MGPIGCPETSVQNNHYLLRNSPKERSCHLRRGERLKSRYVPYSIKVKVKCTLVQAPRLCTGRTAQRGSRGIALLFHDQRHYKGVRDQRHAPAAFYLSEKIRYPLCRRLGGPQGRSGQVRKISPPTGIRSPDRPARSQSLYRLRYPAPFHTPYPKILGPTVQTSVASSTRPPGFLHPWPNNVSGNDNVQTEGT